SGERGNRMRNDRKDDGFTLQGRWIRRVTDAGAEPMWEEPQARIHELMNAIESAQKDEPTAIDADGALLLSRVQEIGPIVLYTDVRIVWSAEPHPTLGLVDAMDEGFLPIAILVRVHTSDVTTLCTTRLLHDYEGQRWAEHYLRQISK